MSKYASENKTGTYIYYVIINNILTFEIKYRLQFIKYFDNKNCSWQCCLR